MHLRVDPRHFANEPLTLKLIGHSDYRVMIAGYAAGRIFMTMRGGMREVWLWTLTGPYCGSADINTSGECEMLQEARLAFRDTFDRWLAWAIRQNAEVSWHQ